MTQRRLAAPPSSIAARNRMLACRGRDTEPELAIRSELFRRGLRYRVARRPSPSIRRTADIVFVGARVAVFVDGCFWHGCPVHATWPRANAAFWRRKIRENRTRDRDTDSQLRSLGWRVVRCWEHEAPARAALRIARVVRVARR